MSDLAAKLAMRRKGISGPKFPGTMKGVNMVCGPNSVNNLLRLNATEYGAKGGEQTLCCTKGCSKETAAQNQLRFACRIICHTN